MGRWAWWVHNPFLEAHLYPGLFGLLDPESHSIGRSFVHNQPKHKTACSFQRYLNTTLRNYGWKNVASSKQFPPLSHNGTHAWVRQTLLSLCSSRCQLSKWLTGSKVMCGFWIHIIHVRIYWGKPVRYDDSKYFKQGLHQSNTTFCWEHRPYLSQYHYHSKVWGQ